jgi:hypothetical protein
MEMAIRKTAICLILTGAAWAQQFPAHHRHLRKFCAGTLTVDEEGLTFRGPKHHVWSWPYQEIQQLTLTPQSIHILSYRDSSLKLGKDKAYMFTGDFPAETLYRRWSAKLDQRFVAAVSTEQSGITFPAKQLGPIKGTDGDLTFATETVTYDSPSAPRTWRYTDIQSISSAGPFQLSLTTLEKQFRFQLKRPITENTYNQLWLDIEKKNGRIQ